MGMNIVRALLLLVLAPARASGNHDKAARTVAAGMASPGTVDGTDRMLTHVASPVGRMAQRVR